MPNPRLLAWRFSLLAVASTLAQSQPTDSLPLLDPVCRIVPPVKGPIECAAFSPDRQTVYALVQAQAVNVTEIVASFWIEILGVLGLILLVLTAIALWRIRRRPRTPGEPHCRRCNYCLKGCPSDRCPECGHSTRRPVVGRPVVRRLLPCLVALTAYGLIAGTAVVIGYPVGVWAAERMPIWSTGLAGAATSVGINLSGWKRPVDQILAFDATTGSLLRTVHTSGAVPSVDGIAQIVSPDGRLLFTVLDATQELVALDTHSGVVRARARAGNREPFTASRWQGVLGFLPDGSMIARVVDQLEGTRIIHWSYTTKPVDLYVDKDMGWSVILLPGPAIRILDAKSVSTKKSELWLGISSSHVPLDSTRISLIEFPAGAGHPARRTELPLLKGVLVGRSVDCRKLYLNDEGNLRVCRIDAQCSPVSSEVISTDVEFWSWPLSERLLAVDSAYYLINGPVLDMESENIVAQLRVSGAGVVQTTPEPDQVPLAPKIHRFGVISNDPTLGDSILIFDVPLPPAD